MVCEKKGLYDAYRGVMHLMDFKTNVSIKAKRRVHL
jgi:hypothetical protein